MARVNFSNAVATDETGSVSDLLNKNWQTTAAVGLTVASGGAAGMIMLGAFPATTIAAGAGIGALAYAGSRRDQGLEILPFGNKSDDKSSDKPVAAVATVVAPA